MRATRTLLAATLTALAIHATGCFTDQVQQDFNTALDSFNAQSDNWQVVLQDLEAKLIDEHSGLAPQVAMIIQQAEATGFDAANCTISHVGAEVKLELNNLKIVNWLQQQAPAPPSPVPCFAVPKDVSVDAVKAGHVSAVSVHGYDFDPQSIDPRLPKPSLSIRTTPDHGVASSVPVDPESGVVTGGPTMLNVNFRTSRWTLPDDSTSMRFLFNDVEKFSLPVFPAQPPPPKFIGGQAIFYNQDDGKDHDSILTVTVAGGIFKYRQSGDLTFNESTTTSVPLQGAAVPITQIMGHGEPFSVCIAPNGNDTWRFDVELQLFTDDGRMLDVTEPGQDVNQDPNDRCTKGLGIPAGQPLVPRPRPVSTPAPTPRPTPVPPNDCVVARQRAHTTRLLVRPTLQRAQLTHPCR